MSMFLDIADEGQRGEVLFRGQQVKVVGLSARQIARLLVNHESVKGLIDGQHVNLIQLIQMAPDAVESCIAYGTGYDDDKPEQFEKARAKASMLTAGEQYDLLMGIFDVTFGERLNPFVKGWVSRAERRVQGALSSPATTEPTPRSTKSVKELKNSLRSDTRPEQFGATHHGNSPATPS